MSDNYSAYKMSIQIYITEDKNLQKIWVAVNSLQDSKILDESKFKAFADDKLLLTQKLKFVLGRVENISGKEENADYQHFLLFPQCFRQLSFPEVLKVGIMW